MSLRKVAAALETGPASLYAYVRDLDELHALVLDRALAKVDLRVPRSGGWREGVVRVLESYAHVLSASPGLANLAFGTIAVGPNAMRVTEKLLDLLDQGGVDPASGAWAVDLVILYVTAIVAEHVDGLEPGAPDGAVANAVANASQGEFPRVFAARDHLLSGTGEERFAWAIEVFLRGIVATPRPAPSPGKRAPSAKKPARSKATPPRRT